MVVGAVLTCCLASCAKSVTGTASAAPGAAPAKTANSGSPSAAPPSGSDPTAAKNAAVCAQVPQEATKRDFGLPDVMVTPDGVSTLDGGVIELKCKVTSSNQFRVNVILQLYPLTVMASVDDFVRIAQDKFPGVQPITVPNVDAAGIFPQTVEGVQLTEVYGVKKAGNTIVAVLTGMPVGPNDQATLTQFLTDLTAN